jgi:hypothetical protein
VKNGEELKLRGVYSIIRTSKWWTDIDAIDWNWNLLYPRRWTHSIQEYGSPHWYSSEQFTDRDYEVLLEHFGLEDWADEFPPQKIITMSPAKLAAARREKERLFGLERKVMLNSTLGYGYNYPAEEFE